MKRTSFWELIKICLFCDCKCYTVGKKKGEDYKGETYMAWGWCRSRRPLKQRRQSLCSYMHSAQRETSSDIAQGSYSDHNLELQVILSWRELSLIAVVSNAEGSQSTYSLIKDCSAEQFKNQTFRVWCSFEVLVCYSWFCRSLDEVACSHSGTLHWEVASVPEVWEI